jgi:hypothetical protein
MGRVGQAMSVPHLSKYSVVKDHKTLRSREEGLSFSHDQLRQIQDNG